MCFRVATINNAEAIILNSLVIIFPILSPQEIEVLKFGLVGSVTF